MSAATLHLAPPPGRALPERRGEPLRCSVPWPPGAFAAGARPCLRDRHGRAVAVQARALERWPDGSVRWLLLDWQGETGAAPYRVEPAASEPPPSAPITVEREAADGLVLSGAGLSYRAGPGGRLLAVSAPGRPGEVRITLEGSDGEHRALTTRIDRVEIAERGPLRARLALAGSLELSGRALLALAVEIELFAGLPAVRLRVAVTNPRPAAHPGGQWRLGAPGSVYLERLTLRAALVGAGPGEARGALSPEPDAPLAPCPLPALLYQDSSGGEQWASRVHVNREGRVPVRRRGYVVEAEGTHAEGLRATPLALLERDPWHLALAMRHFWQNFPKGLGIGESALELHLFPAEHGDLHELQGGERKTHECVLGLGPDGVGEGPLEWVREPLLAHPEPAWYAAAGAAPWLTPAAPGEPAAALVASLLEGPASVEAKRERVDEYGWRHFGDLWADHEEVFCDAPRPVISHYNNQYDALRGFAVQFMRSAERRWFEWMEELAAHVADIDCYHTDGDKSAYSRGMFWHTDHYADAATSTHRSFPAGGKGGGGPSPGHLYTTGLLLHHLLTGSEASRRAVLALGEYVIAADDGARTVFRWLARGPTGHISSSGYDGYHGPGRTPGNALNALVDAHRLSGEARFLAKARELVHRCIHPCDDLAARRLEDVENRWYYMVFLEALAKYLAHLETIGGPPEERDYARAALLHYARWALEHEEPYLDHPERLEYPTETWAAQDLRKALVLNLAAARTRGEEQRRLRERARFFHREALATLAGMDTHMLTRPQVLVLAYGYPQAWFEAHDEPAADDPPPASAEHFGEPRTFVPQKQQALRRLGALCALGGAALAAAATWAVLR